MFIELTGLFDNDEIKMSFLANTKSIKFITKQTNKITGKLTGNTLLWFGGGNVIVVKEAYDEVKKLIGKKGGLERR